MIVFTYFIQTIQWRIMQLIYYSELGLGNTIQKMDEGTSLFQLIGKNGLSVLLLLIIITDRNVVVINNKVVDCMKQ